MPSVYNEKYRNKRLKFGCFGVKEPRHSENIVDKKTTLIVARLFQPLSLFVRACTNPPKLSSTRLFRCWPAVPANAARTSLLHSLRLLCTMTTGAPVVRGSSPVRRCPTELAEFVCAEVDSLTRVMGHLVRHACSSVWERFQRFFCLPL